ncbi:cysteine--tRNA ligase [Candidatus Woesearchaeota archaeon]|nr:cysteine--tRNA ligase [Candidatus Woesearchaeota archaeon]
MALFVYNTLTRTKEEFKPMRKKKINLFVCGITPYDYAHLGHAKTYIQFDVIVKYLRFLKYNVVYLQNITDIDDKIIQRAQEKGIDWKDLASHYEQNYLENMHSLKVDSVTRYAKATDHIPEIVSQVQRLARKGYAYKISDGYYFDISKFKDYGKLAKRTAEQAEDSISRIDENNEKRNKGDFCLWKFKKDNEPFWETKIGTGRPGWHIEDTAITEKYFGVQYDIHGGAVDLIFPHHEAEIAQMEAISGKVPLVRYWLHTGFLNVNKEKMSKSLGNFFTIQDALKQYSPSVLRYVFLSSHYRKPLDFSLELLENAKGSLQRIQECVRNLGHCTGKGKSNACVKEMITKRMHDFTEAMNDDFETANALAVIFSVVRETNSLLQEKKLSASDAKKILKFFLTIDSVFSLLEQDDVIPKHIIDLAEQREQARKKKDWKQSDLLREALKKEEYGIDDTPYGYVLKKL